MEPHVKILRDFRDRYLLGNMAGKGFVRLYYTYSPPLADFIAKHEIVRMGLLPIVGLSWVALKFGPLVTLAFFLFFVLRRRPERSCVFKDKESQEIVFIS